VTEIDAVELRIERVELRDHTTLRVGGPAELWTAEGIAGLIEATREPFSVLGAGSNLLVSDRGVTGRVVRLGQGFNDIRAIDGRSELWLGAATPLPGLVRRAQRLGLSGLEGLLGIPAVLGGAVAMNAGTRFGSAADAVDAVELLVDGGVERVAISELDPGYRRLALPDGAVIVRAHLTLTPSTPERVAAAMTAVDAARKGQPRIKSAGCAFKNPEGDSAGRLIDEAGLKGLRVGDAMVAHEHGNFIVNLGGATSAEVVELLAQITSRVEVPLELEWRRWGEL
jgi:UDP-N-acetylmuramate dehydrogenase